MSRLLLRPHLAFLLVLLVTGCGSTQDVDREAILESLGEEVIAPAYGMVAAEADSLARSAERFAESPSDSSLDAARSAWLDASLAWESTRAFELGPVPIMQTASRVSFRPLRPGVIERAIADADTLDSTYVSDLSVAAKGLAAVEYLLFEDPEAMTGEALIGEGSELQQRRRYLSLAARQAAEQAQELYDAWRPEAGDYADTWGQQGEGEDAGRIGTPQKAFSLLLLRSSKLMDDMQMDYLEPALEGGDGEIPFERSGAVREHLLHQIDGIQRIWRAGDVDEQGLHRYVFAMDEGLADRFTELLETARAEVGDLPADVRPTGEAQRQAVQEAQSAADEVYRTIETDIASALGLTSVFTDNDGD